MKSLYQIAHAGTKRQKCIQLFAPRLLLKQSKPLTFSSRFFTTPTASTLKVKTAAEIIKTVPTPPLTPEYIVNLKEKITALIKEKEFAKAEKLFFQEGLHRQATL